MAQLINPFENVTPDDALSRGETSNEIAGFNEATGAYDPSQNLWQPQSRSAYTNNQYDPSDSANQQPSTTLAPRQQPQPFKQPSAPQGGMTTLPNGAAPLNQQTTLGMVDYLKQNLGKTPADANLKSDLDNVSRMVKAGTAYTNWAYCAGILYAAAQKSGVSNETLGNIKSPLLASAWQLGQRQDTPSVGNFAYWPHGHISMVSDYDPQRNMVKLIGGNQGARVGQFRPVSQTDWVPSSYSGVRYYRGYQGGGQIDPNQPVLTPDPVNKFRPPDPETSEQSYYDGFIKSNPGWEWKKPNHTRKDYIPGESGDAEFNRDNVPIKRRRDYQAPQEYRTGGSVKPFMSGAQQAFHNSMGIG